MDFIVASLPLQSKPPFPFSFSSRIPITGVPNRRFLKRHRKYLISLASVSTTPLISFASKSTPIPSESVVKGEEERSISECLLKQLVRTLFCFAVGFSALGTFRVPALAIAAPWTVLEKKGSKNETVKGHEYSDCTDRLLETVSGLLRSIDEVRKGNGDVSEVELALNVMKTKKEECKREIMGRLYPVLRKLRREKGQLGKRGWEILGEIVYAKGEYDRLKLKVVGEKEKERIEELEQRVGELEQEYNGIWDRIGEIEDLMSRKETVALSYGVREISFIERECEQLVERFKQEMRWKDIKRSHAFDSLNAFLCCDMFIH